MPNPRQIFFHMPKTAGQTFTILISREYPGRVIDTHCGVLIPEDWEKFLQAIASTPEAELRQSRAVVGHMRFGAHALLPGPSQYITFMRDPVQRYLSYYHMIKRLELIPADHQFDLSRADWNQPAESWFVRELDNGQTRALSNADWELPFRGCTEDHFQTALANLENHFAFIGLTEHFDVSVLLVSRRCHWRPHFYAPKNVTPRLESWKPVSSQIKTAISDLNSFDRRLYAYACDRFEREVRAAEPSLRLQLGLFRAGNAIHGKINRLRRKWKARKA